MEAKADDSKVEESKVMEAKAKETKITEADALETNVNGADRAKHRDANVSEVMFSEAKNSKTAVKNVNIKNMIMESNVT